MNSEALLILYLISAVGIIVLCSKEIQKCKMNMFFLYGTSILAFPISMSFLIQTLGVKLAEATLALILWTPGVVLGFVILFTTRITHARPEFMLFLAPTFVALFNGLYTSQTSKYPLIFLLLTAPFFFCFSIQNSMDQIKNTFLVNTIAILGFHVFSLLLQSQPSIGRCGIDKCSLFGFVLTPFGEQSNLTSIIYALIFPYLAFFLKNRQFVWATFFFMISATISGGRTGLFAIIGLAVVRLLTHSKSSAKRKLFFSLLSVGIFLVSLIPVFKSYPNESFTGRGLLWNISREQIASNVFFGSGPSFWVRLPEISSLTAFYSSHNLWLELSVSTGVVATLCFGIALVSKCWVGIKENQKILLYVIYAFLLCGTFESPIMPYRTVQAPGFYIFFLLVLSFNSAPRILKEANRDRR